MKPRARCQPPLAPSTPEAEGPLSPARTFVVQFRQEPEGAPNHFRGRVEHMVSGRATRFSSSEELLAFFTGMLGNVQE